MWSAHTHQNKTTLEREMQAAKKWTMPIRDWKKAVNRFIVEFGDRVERHL